MTHRTSGEYLRQDPSIVIASKTPQDKTEEEPKEKTLSEQLAEIAKSPERSRELAKRIVERLREQFDDLSESGEDVIRRMETEFPQGFSGLELAFLFPVSSSDKVIYVNKDGRLDQLVVTEQNAKQTLESIKTIDRDDLHRNGHSYDLRQLILHRSGNQIESRFAYIYPSVLDSDGNPLNKKEVDMIVDEESSWVPERREIHEQILHAEFEATKKLSQKMGEVGLKDTIVAMRGNSASGKTTLLKTREEFQQLSDPETGKIDGIVNVDRYKASLRLHEADPDGWQHVDNQRVHYEGAMLRRKLKARLDEIPNGSFIYDERFDNVGEIQKMLDLANEAGKTVRMIDLDVPLAISMARVVSRTAGGEDPLVDGNAVEKGFLGIRKSRKALIEEAVSRPVFAKYQLYAFGKDGIVLIAEKSSSDEALHVMDQDLFHQLQDVNLAALAEDIQSQIKKREFNEQFFEELTAQNGLSEHVQRALIKWVGKGKSFFDLVQERSFEKNEIPPSFRYYAKASARNLNILSRTAKGKVDTSASADKAEKMDESLTEKNAAERVAKNFNEVLTVLGEKRAHTFASPQELRTFIEQIYKLMSQGIVDENKPMLREGKEAKNENYTQTGDVPAAFNQFVEEFFVKLNDPNADPIETAAWVDYRVNLSDHFFTDGCNKMMLALGTWVMMRADKRLPIYPERSKFYSHTPKTRRDLSTPTSEDANFQNYLAYFKKFVPKTP